MKVITFINQKGGVGKTTLALSMASAWHLEGRSVAVIDADPQQSAVAWKQCQKEGSPLFDMEVYSIDNQNDFEDLSSLPEEYIIIDTAGNDTPLTSAALKVSDMVIIPIKPSAMDAKASINTYRKVKAENKPCLYILNQTIQNSTLVDETLNALRDSGVPHLERHVGTYIQFVRTLGNGETPFSDQPYSMASVGLKKVMSEVEGALNGS